MDIKEKKTEKSGRVPEKTKQTERERERKKSTRTIDKRRETKLDGYNGAGSGDGLIEF